LIEDLQEVQQLPEPKTLDNFEPAISTTPLPNYGDVAIKKPPNYTTIYSRSNGNK